MHNFVPGRIATFIENLTEEIPAMLGNIDGANSEVFAGEVPVWSGAEIDGDTITRIDNYPAFAIFWRDRPLDDDYQQRKFSHVLLTILLYVKKQSGSLHVQKYWANAKDVFIQELTDIRYLKQKLGIYSFKSTSSSQRLAAVTSKQVRILEYRMEFDTKLV